MASKELGDLPTYSMVLEYLPAFTPNMARLEHLGIGKLGPLEGKINELGLNGFHGPEVMPFRRDLIGSLIFAAKNALSAAC